MSAFVWKDFHCILDSLVCWRWTKVQDKQKPRSDIYYCRRIAAIATSVRALRICTRKKVFHILDFCTNQFAVNIGQKWLHFAWTRNWTQRKIEWKYGWTQFSERIELEMAIDDLCKRHNLCGRNVSATFAQQANEWSVMRLQQIERNKEKNDWNNPFWLLSLSKAPTTNE